MLFSSELIKFYLCYMCFVKTRVKAKLLGFLANIQEFISDLGSCELSHRFDPFSQNRKVLYLLHRTFDSRYRQWVHNTAHHVSLVHASIINARVE